MDESNKLMPFGNTEIRKAWYNEQWYFVLDDVLVFLTDTQNPKAYWSNLRRKDEELKKGYGKIYSTLSVATEGGKQKMNCANTEGVLRIVMSVTSPKVEPLKLWMAQVGRERIEETENPELAIERAKEIYAAKGYSDDWIATRLKTIETRNELTAEWKKRGIKDSKDYSFLTATIAKGTFGLNPSEHAQLKGLEKQNLRDHMTNLELIFSMLGEESTRMIAEKDNAQGFSENYDAAIEGGQLTGKHREQLEQRAGQKVVSADNYLHLKSGSREELPRVDDTIQE
jgi:DNA-damage-inducible protein D